MTEVGQQVISSCSGALVTALLMTPLDVIKIRLQAQAKGFVKGECFLYCNGLMDHVCTCLNGDNGGKFGKPVWRRPSTHLNGTLDALIKIPRTEGIASLWSGLPPTLAMAIPSTVIYFTLYDQLKRLLGYDEITSSKLIPFCCASAARAGAVTAVTPLELIRTKVQSEKMSYRDLGKAINLAMSQGGVLSLWRGWSPMIWRDVPFSGLYFTFYEGLKSYSLQTQHTDSINTLQSFTFGAISGTLAGVVTLPFDVVKTHRQVEIGSTKLAGAAGTIRMLRDLYRTQGIRSWYTGMGPRILKVAPACAIMISSYEYCKRLFAKINSER